MKHFSRLLGLLLLTYFNTSIAATDTGTLTVTATVTASCNIGDATMNFGAYDPASATATDANTTVSVTCTNGSAYHVYSTTSLSDRKMTTGGGGSGKELTFGIYGTTTDRTAGTQLPVTNTTGEIDGIGTGSTQSIDLYGRIPPQQNVQAGSYSNSGTTNLTIEY